MTTAIIQDLIAPLALDVHQNTHNQMHQRRTQIMFYKIFQDNGEIDVLDELFKRIPKTAKQIDMPVMLGFAAFRKNFYTAQALKDLTVQEVNLLSTLHDITYQDFATRYGPVSVIG